MWLKSKPAMNIGWISKQDPQQLEEILVIYA